MAEGRLTQAEALAAMPPPEVVSDALIGPLLPGSSKHVHVFAARTGDVLLQHFHIDGRRGLRDINQVRAASPQEIGAAPLVPGVTLYAGPYAGHFGHMLAEGMHRLWAAALRPELKQARIAFQAREGRETATEPWFAELLALYGITPEQVLFVNAPMRFAELHVPVQGRALGGEMLVDHYDALFPIAPIKPERKVAARLYVSRRQHMFSGSYLGESLVETLLGRAGYEIVYPETIPLRSMLRKLAGAREIIFCEGSAIHHLELTGRLRARIFVIGRRQGTADRFDRVLDAGCEAWTVFEEHHGSVCLDWDKGRDAPMRSRACSFVDLPKLLEALSAFAGVSLPQPDEAAVRRAESLDLLRVVMDQRTGATATDEQFGRMLRAVRRSEGVRKLMPRLRRSRARPLD